MRLALVCICGLFATAAPALAQEETVLQKPSGETATVRTDAGGTTVDTNGAERNRTPIGTSAPGPDAHDKTVRSLQQQGATITSESKDSK